MEEEPRRYSVLATGAEAKNYDFARERDEGEHRNVIGSIGCLIRSCLAGALVVHESYSYCGLVAGLVVNLILGVFVTYCMHVLVKSAHTMYGRVHETSMSYPDLAEASLATGPFPRLRKYDKMFRGVVIILISVNFFGSSSIGIIIMSKTIRHVLQESGVVPSAGQIPINYYIICVFFPCFMLIMVSSLGKLAWIPNVYVFFVMIVAVSTVFYGFRSAKSPADVPHFKSFDGLLRLVLVCAHAMGGFSAVLTVENNMAEPGKFRLVLIVGMSIVMITVIAIGFFGYWAFGDDPKLPITHNYPWSSFPITLNIITIFLFYTTSCLNFWRFYTPLWSMKNEYVQDPKDFWILERIVRGLSFFFIVGTAYNFPNAIRIAELLGSFSTSYLGFIFPAFSQLAVTYEDPGLGYMNWRLLRFLAIFLFGSMLCFFGFFMNALK